MHNTPYADSFLRAWSTVVGTFFLLLPSVGLLSTFGAFQSYYASSLLSTYSPSDISWIGSVQLCLELAGGPVAGVLFDKGWARVMMGAGCGVFLISLFMLSLVQQGSYYQIFLAQGIGMGISLAFVYTPSFAVISLHFRKHRALAMGIVASSAPLGGVIFTIMFNTLIDKGTSFPWAVRYIGFIALGCFLAGNALLMPPRMIKSTSAGMAEASGKRDGAMSESESSPSNESRGSSCPSRQPASPQNSSSSPVVSPEFSLPPRTPPSTLAPRNHSIRPTLLLLLLISFTGSLALYFPPFYIQMLASGPAGSSSSPLGLLSLYALAVLNASNAVGRIASGWIADRNPLGMGVVRVFSGCLAITGALTFAMLGASTEEGLLLFLIFYGSFFGASISLFPPAITFLLPREVDLGRTIGIVLAPSGIASLVGPPAAGALIGTGNKAEWWRGVLFAALALFLSAACTFVADYLHARGRSREQRHTADMALSNGGDEIVGTQSRVIDR